MENDTRDQGREGGGTEERATPAAAGGVATAAAGDASVVAHGHGEESDHGEPRYFLIWAVLLILTLAEVGYAFLPFGKFWLALGLIVMAFWKAALVALYYMHLRWEPRRLWVLAAAPLPLVAILILAVLTEY